MRILYCYEFGILGGVCTQLINRLSVLAGRHGVEAHLLFARDMGIGATLRDYPRVAFESGEEGIRRRVLDHRYDAIVVIDSPRFLEVLRETSVPPPVLEIHTTTELGLGYLSSNGHRPAGVIVPSEYSRELVRDRFAPGDELRVEVIPNVVDRSLFEWTSVRNPPGRPVIGWVGKLDDHKNWRGFLDFAALLTSRGTEADFWLVGGETANESRQLELIEQIDRRGLSLCCRWFPRIEYDQMHRLYACIRQSWGAMVITSIDESFGMSALEALVCGCPVIASDVGGIAEIAPGRPYLQLYPFEDYESAVEQARALLDDGAAVRNALAEERSQLLDRFSADRVMGRYVETLRSMVGVQAPVTRRLLDAVDSIRPFLPDAERRNAEPEEFLEHLRHVLSFPSYRLARTVATRQPGLRDWLRIVATLWRLMSSRRTRRSSRERRAQSSSAEP